MTEEGKYQNKGSDDFDVFFLLRTTPVPIVTMDTSEMKESRRVHPVQLRPLHRLGPSLNLNRWTSENPFNLGSHETIVRGATHKSKDWNFS